MLKTKKKIDDKMPSEAATPIIMHSANVLVRTIGTGASLGTFPSIGSCTYTNIQTQLAAYLSTPTLICLTTYN